MRNGSLRNFKDYRNEEFTLLYRRECETKEEANAWGSGLFLFTCIDGRLRGRKVAFINRNVRFGRGAWKAVNWLARKRHFQVVPVNGPRGSPSEDYALYFQNQDVGKDSQDHQSIVYKIKVDELVYIGEQSVYATKRAPFPRGHFSKNMEEDQTKCSLLEQRLIDKGLDPTTELLDYVTIGECLKASTSQFLPEAVAMLTYCAKWDILRNYDDKIINMILPYTSLPATWFDEIQYYLYELTGGRTIEIVTEEGFKADAELFGDN